VFIYNKSIAFRKRYNSCLEYRMEAAYQLLI